jgi:DUF2934 family protein
MSGDKDARIREEAFLLSNADEYPEGNADEYWYRAEKVIDHRDKLLEKEEKRGGV